MTPPPAAPAARPVSGLVMWLHGLLALLALWLFHSLLWWGFLNALPQQDTADGLVLAVSAGLCGAAAVALSSVLSPWLLDRLLRVTWIKLEEAGDVGPHLRAVLEQCRLPVPYLGVVADSDPCALTYGLTRRAARLVVTRGLLESLDVDQQCAIVTHEAAHLASGDFRLATMFAGPIFILTRVKETYASMSARGGTADDSTSPSSQVGGLMIPVVGLLIRAYALIYAGFAQCREVWADQFTQRRVDARALEGALLALLTRLAGPSPTRHALAVAARGFTPVDAVSAGRLGTASAWSGQFDAAQLARTAAVVASNPATELSQQSALHPPIGTRLPSEALPVQTVSALTLLRLFASTLPAVGFGAGLLVVLMAGGIFGLPLIMWGLGRMIALGLAFGRMHGSVQNEAGLRDVLEKLASEPARAYQTELVGRFVGRGVPGVTWCTDAVFECAGVYLAVRPCVLIGSAGGGVRDQVLGAIEGKACKVRGVLRTADVPYLELHAVESDGQLVWRSAYVVSSLIWSTVLVMLGILLIAPQWAGF